MFLAEVAPAAPLEAFGVDLGAGLGLIAALIVMVGLRAAWEDTLGRVLNALANVLDVKVWKINLRGGGALRKLNSSIEAAMGAAILRIEQGIGLYIHANRMVVEYAVDSLEWFASSTVDAFSNLVHGTIPKVTTTVVKPVATDLGKLRRLLNAETIRLERELDQRARGLEAEIDNTFGKAWRGVDYLRGTAIPQLWRSLHGLEADVAGLEGQVGRVIPHRLTRLEKFLGAGVLGGIGIAALTRVFPYWQCSNVKRLMRNVCRSPFGALDALFAFAAITTLLVKPSEVVAVGEEIEGVLAEGLRVMAGISDLSFADAEEDIVREVLDLL